MLIIPAERRLDWRRPPIVTLLLILINVAIFFGYQRQDGELWHQALDYYLQQELHLLEAPEYLDYLERRISLGQDSRTERPQLLSQLIQDENHVALGALILSDRDFTAYLHQEGHRFWHEQTLSRWQQQRQHLEQSWLQYISSYRFGLVPAEIGLDDLIVYQFLHGNFSHLLGNMIFLFLLGFAVEATLGKFRYVLSYLACGAISGLFYSLLESSSYIPLVGASGAISGLMGIYVTTYRLQKIRFFFWVGFYFNYFRAPALSLLPVWLGKELLDYWQNHSSGVAYMAHAGGLLAGSAITLLLTKWSPVHAEVDEDEDEENLRFRKDYSAALEAVSRVDLEQARQRFRRLVERHPDKPGMLEHLYHLEKLKPDNAAYIDCADRLIASALKANQTGLAINIYRDVRKRVPTPDLVPDKWHYRLLITSLRENNLKEAEAAFQALQSSNTTPEILGDAGQALAHAFRMRKMTNKADHYEGLVGQLKQSNLNTNPSQA